MGDTQDFFLYNNFYAGTLSTLVSNFFCVKILLCKHYFSPLNTFVRKGLDPDPQHWNYTQQVRYGYFHNKNLVIFFILFLAPSFSARSRQ